MNLREFTAHLEKQSEAVTSVVTSIQKRVILGIHDRLISRPGDGGTPIDHGTARGSWGINEGSAGSYVLQQPGANAEGVVYGEDAAKKQQGKVNNIKPFGIWWIFNNLPYIVNLNNGSSDQAPALFVEDAVELENEEMIQALENNNQTVDSLEVLVKK